MVGLALQDAYTVLKEIYDVPDSLFHKRMDFLNEVWICKEFIKDPVRTLSLGQRMRADIAASLLHNPKVLFLDERLLVWMCRSRITFVGLSLRSIRRKRPLFS